MNEMCKRANMTDREVYDRWKGVFEYLDLPITPLRPFGFKGTFNVTGCWT